MDMADQSSYLEDSGGFMPESQRDTRLPMVVNLRGDEDYVEEFVVDAQEAMEFLGIKRSRLTQISGRELRVGRIRKDRYLRPVYRRRDLEDYRQWTRSTASHQSSSLVVEHAVQKLEQQCQEFERVTKESLQNSLEDLVASSQRQLLLQVENRLQRLQHDLREYQSSARRQSQHMHRQLDALGRSEQLLLDLSRSIRQKQDLGLEIMSQLHQVVRESSVFLGDLRESLQRMIDAQYQGLLDFQESLLAQWQDASERQSQSELRIQETLQLLSTQLEDFREVQNERHAQLMKESTRERPEMRTSHEPTHSMSPGKLRMRKNRRRSRSLN